MDYLSRQDIINVSHLIQTSYFSIILIRSIDSEVQAAIINLYCSAVKMSAVRKKIFLSWAERKLNLKVLTSVLNIKVS